MSNDADHIRNLAATKLANHITSIEAERDDLRDKLLAALEDNDFLRSLLRTIVEEVSGVYGGHSEQAREAMAVAQKMFMGGKPDGD